MRETIFCGIYTKEPFSRELVRGVVDVVLRFERVHKLLFTDLELAKSTITDMVVANLYGHILLGTTPTNNETMDALYKAIKQYRRGLCELDTSRWPS
jgi:hypothetical protein